jgi:hypothetical protein
MSSLVAEERTKVRGKEKMKIFYLNDEHKPVTIQTIGQLRPSPTNKFGEPTIEYFKLEPQESRVFEIDAPEGAMAYVKRWETRVVLLTYALPEELPTDPSLQRKS